MARRRLYLLRYIGAMTTAMLIYEARTRAGLTQQALARAAGTSQPTIARYESGRAEPRVDTLNRILSACGRRLDTAEASARHEHIPARGPLGRRLRRLRGAITAEVAQAGLTNARVFGSVARGEDTSQSDIDILVDVPYGSDILVVSELEERLSQLLGAQVDVTTPRLLRPPVLERAELEAISI